MFRFFSAIFAIVTMITGFNVWAGDAVSKSQPSAPAESKAPTAPSTQSAPIKEPNLLEEAEGGPEVILTTTPEDASAEEKVEQAPIVPTQPTPATPRVEAKSAPKTKVKTEANKTEAKAAKRATTIEEKQVSGVSASIEAPGESQAPMASAQTAKMDLDVLEFVLANKVEGREPQEVVDVFANSAERGFAFARLNVKTPGKVTFVWYRNDHEYTRFTTTVQAAQKWRTYSSVKLRPGNWAVKLLAEDNSVLAEKTFILK